jgi:hypothetical protein
LACYARPRRHTVTPCGREPWQARVGPP